MLRKNPLSVAVATVVSSLVGAQAFAQGGATEEVIVTGIKGSLQRALDVKRDATGVVDAISAEDIGKMPDTNLAESLQRITGVSINRVNGEGSEVTVRGFGGSFNLVTVNGRQLPSANVTSITGNPVDQGSQGVSRSFDFSNLASEGVNGIQVYKTGRASVATGGVGATINISTIKPLEAGGTKASFGVKAVEDTSGDETTPEVSGLYSWANDEGTFGVSVFGSYQERNSGSRHMSVENYFPAIWSDETQFNWGMSDATIINEPEDGTVVARPSNIGLGFNEDERERTNGMITLQFAPNDEMTITVDASYAENVQESVALIDGLWHQAGSYTNVEFDGNPLVGTPVKLEEEFPDGGVDFFFQNLVLAVEDTLETVGVNFDWQASDDLNLAFDFSTAKAESGPNGPFGKNALRFNIAGQVAGWRAWDYTLNIPQVSVQVDEQRTSDPNGPNGILDQPDIGTQVIQDQFSQQTTETDQFQINGTWEWKEDVTIAFGASYLGTEMDSEFENGLETLGGWGIENPGDVPDDLFFQTCSGCQFDADLSRGTPDQGNAPGNGETIPLGSNSWRGNAEELFIAMANAMSTELDAFGDPIWSYPYTPGDLTVNGFNSNSVEEDIIAVYAQADFDGQLAGMDTHVTVGVRWEETEVKSTANQILPTAFVWLSDNDFQTTFGDDIESFSGEAKYNNFLPSIDVSLNLTEDVKARASFSQTLARPTYDQYFLTTGTQSPPTPGFFGGEYAANRGNVALDPLESNNVDLSLEWYYGDANTLSVGYYRKDVSNFVGTAIVDQELFGLRDATSGAAGSRSGDAAAALMDGGFDLTESNLFTMTAILDNPTDFPGGASDFSLDSNFQSTVFADYDVTPNADDPLINFGVAQPVNNQTATIYGFELVSQHFFGDTGFGYQANFTTVEGDIEYDIDANPDEDQFALQGLSDSANLVLIYEKHGISARLLYNWRDTFLNQVQRAASGSNRMPEFIDEYEQWDLNISYEINDNFSVSLDVINLTEEETRHFGRTESQVFFIQELDTRYVLGLRYAM